MISDSKKCYEIITISRLYSLKHRHLLSGNFRQKNIFKSDYKGIKIRESNLQILVVKIKSGHVLLFLDFQKVVRICRETNIVLEFLHAEIH